MEAGDVLLIVVIILGTVGATWLLKLRARVRTGSRWKMWEVFLLAFVWVFVVSDIAEHLDRLYYPHDVHGTMFSRAFLLIGIALVVYLRVSERTAVPVQNKNKSPQEEGMP